MIRFIRRLFRLEVDDIGNETFECLDDDPQSELYFCDEFYDDIDPGTGFPLESDM
jgi:hypothetical protein